MSIRLRRTSVGLIAVCAARSIPKDGDTYLDDEQHHALAEKFSADFASEGFYSGPAPSSEISQAVDREESNNVNRTNWDRTFGGERAEVAAKGASDAE